MSSIDRRVVEMEFDNKKFQKGVEETLTSIEQLKKGLTFDGATKGLDELNAAGGNVDLSGIADGVDHISNRFSAMGAVGFTIIQNLTTAAMDYAKRISGLVMDPLVAGGKRRAENIEQAKFQFRGLGVDVEKAMEDALYGVKDTAYGLDEAAKAASQLSASQVELGDDMKASLRGISGVAAMTNSSYEDTARVFTRVAGQGRVMAVDLNSLAARGLNAAATLADAFDVTEAEIREMVTEGEISFDMFSTAMNDAFGENATKANETYSGSLSNLRAALSRIGASFFGKHLENSRDLFNALTPVVDNLGSALEPLISAFVDLSTVRTSVLSDFLSNLDFSDLPLVLEPLLGIVRDLFNMFVSIATPIKRAFAQIFPPTTLKDIGALLSVIEEFTDSIKMGAETADNLRRTFAGVFAVFSIGWSVVKELAGFLFNLFGIVTEGSGGFLNATANVGDFLVALDQAIKNGEGLTNFFRGLTRVLEFPINALKNLAGLFFSLFDFDAPSADRLSATFEPLGRVGHMLLFVWERVVRGLSRVADLFRPIMGWVRDFSTQIGETLTDVFGDLSFEDLLQTFETGLLGGLFLMFQRIAKNTTNQVGSVAFNLTSPFRKLTYSLEVMQTTLRAMTLMQIAIAIGILAASVVALSKVDPAGLTRALTAMTVMFTQLMASLKGFTMIGGAQGLMGTAGGLVLLAVAIRILTSAVKAMADLSWEELARGLTGVTALLAGLIIAVRGMSGHTAGMVKAGAGLMILAVGIRILVTAVERLSGLTWEEMARGLVGVGTLLASMAIFTRLAAVNKGGLAQGAGLLLLAVGIRVLADAVAQFAKLSWEEVGKGLATVSAILAAFAIFSQTVGNPSKLMASGAALVLVGVAMNMIARAMDQFGDMSWEEITKGMLGMAGALAAIVMALNLMPPSTLASAAALVGVGVALGFIADAMDQMGGMSYEEIYKGVGVLAGSLGIIAVSLNLMTGALPGAAAVLVVAGALRILAPVLMTFAGMSIGEIAKSLGMLVGIFAIFAVAGLALAPVVPVLMGLAGAMALIGVGLLAAGAGVLAFSAGMTALAASGAAGGAAIVSIVAGLAGLLPVIAKQVGMALIVLLEVIAEAGPAMMDAFIAILDAIFSALDAKAPDIIGTLGDMALQLVQKLTEIIPQMAQAGLDMMIALLDALIEKAPVIVGKMIELVVTLLNEISSRVPEYARAATGLLVAMLEAIANNMDRVITTGADIVIAFIEGIQENSNRIIDAGMEAVIAFINGISDSIDEHGPELREAGIRLAGQIADGMTFGLASKVGDVVNGARGLAGSALNAAKDRLGVRSPSKEFRKLGQYVGDGFVKGMQDSRDNVLRTYDNLWGLLQNARKKALTERKRLDSEMAKLQKIEDPDPKTIVKMFKIARAQGKNTRELHAANDALDYMSKAGKKQRNELARLGRQYEVTTKKLDDANRALQDAKQIRDDYSRSVRDQMNDIPDISRGYGVERFTNELRDSITKLSKFTNVMAKLRKMGLGDAMYEELLSQGPGALRFAEELLAGGKASVQEVNNLTGQLAKRSKRLGTVASRELYQAGVDSAQGLVDGLKKKEKQIDKQMQRIAKALAAAVKKELGIRSPSKVMAELGGFTIDGLVDGMKKSTPAIAKAASDAGGSAVDAMKKSISDMSNLISMETDMDPVIKPVIDMTEIKKGAAEINAAMSDQQLLIDSAYSKAKNASLRHQANREALLTPDKTSELAGVSMTYNQYNQSPKALSSAEIYRQTRNQLSTTKGALTDAT